MNDVFGKALYDYWQDDQPSVFIVRRDDGHTDAGSVEGYFAKELDPSEKVISHYVKGKVLDVGCGAGRHVLHFQNTGLEITGIDNSPMAVKACLARGCKEVALMDIFQPDFGGDLFDTVLLFGNNIGIGGALDGVKRLLLAIKEVTKPGGVLLLTTVDVTKTNNEKHQSYQNENIVSGRYVGELKIQMEYKGQVGEWIPWVHIQPEILKPLAQEIGWAIVEITESEEGDCSIVLRSV